MRLIAVDDEPLVLGGIMSAISSVYPDATVQGFRTPHGALEYATCNTVDVAFLDIEMASMNGLELAKRLKEIRGNTNIIFVTAFSEYAMEAHRLYVTDYILKPVSASKITSAMENLRHPIVESTVKVRVQTFGNFEVFANNHPIHFSRLKSKEILAYIVDKNGTSVNKSELSSMLWEGSEYNRSKQQQLQEIISCLVRDLKAVGAEKMLVRGHNCLSVDKEQFECDAYSFMNWDVAAINSYCGEYMSNYSWAEFKLAYIEHRFHGLKSD